MARLNSLQQRRSNKAPDHRPAPVERNISGGYRSGHRRNAGQTEIVHKEAADGNFRSYVSEDPDGPIYKVGMLPDGVFDLLAGATLRGFDLRQVGGADHD